MNFRGRWNAIRRLATFASATTCRDFAIKRPNALSVSGWRPLFGGARDHIDPALVRELTDELDFFDANWPNDLPAGVAER